MNHRRADKLEQCLAYLETGASLEDCFQQFPDLTPDLRKMLATASQLMSLNGEEVPSQAMIHSHINILKHSNELIATSRSSKSHTSLRTWVDSLSQVFHENRLVSRLVLIVGIAVLLILFSGGLAITSAKSLPGDSLYPVKRAVEDIRIHLIPNGEMRIEYEENYSQQRVTEIDSLLKMKRIVQISFEGILQSRDGISWMISGIPVMVNDKTTIVKGAIEEKAIEIGDVVEVEGFTNNQGLVSANEVQLREYQVSGLVEKISDHSWIIAGIPLLITQDTEIGADIRKGDEVIVRVRSEDDNLSALTVQREIHATETPEDLPSLTPAPTELAPIDEENHQFTGALGQVNSDAWVVGGKTFYLSPEIHLPEEVNIGDIVEIKFHISASGTYLATEIERVESSTSTEEYQTPASTDTQHEGEHQVTPTLTPTPAHEEDGATQTPGSTPTTKPTDDD